MRVGIVVSIGLVVVAAALGSAASIATTAWGGRQVSAAERLFRSLNLDPVRGPAPVSAKAGPPSAPAPRDLPVASGSPAGDEGHWVFVTSAESVDAQLQTQRRIVSELAERLDQAERRTSDLADVQARLETERARTTRLNRDLAETQARLAATSARPEKTEPAARLDEEGHHAADLAAKVADGVRAGAEVASLTSSLEAERARSASLDRDLGGLKDRIAQAGSAADGQKQAFEAERVDAQAKLQAEERHVADLAAKVAEGEKTGAEVASLTSSLEAERARSSGLDRNLEGLKARVAQAESAADGQKQAFQAERVDAEAKLQAEQHQAADLAAKVAEGEKTGAEVASLTSSLEAERVRSASLNNDLRVLRDQLAQNAAAADQQRHAFEADADIKLEAERHRGADLAAKVTDIGKTGAEVASLSTGLAAERARSAGLDRDLAALKAQIAQNAAVADQQRHAFEGERADAEAKFQAEQHRAADLAARVIESDKAGAEVTSLSKGLAAERVRSASLDRDLAALKAQVAQTAAAADQQRQARLADEASASAKLAAEQQRSTALAAEIAGLHTDVGESARLRETLGREQARSASLERELGAARTRLTEASQAASIGEDVRREDGAKLKDSAAQLLAAQRRTAELQARADAAERTAAALRGKPEVSDGRDLSAARAQVADLQRVREGELRSAQAAARTAAQSLQTEEDKTASLSAKAADAERKASEANGLLAQAKSNNLVVLSQRAARDRKAEDDALQAKAALAESSSRLEAGQKELAATTTKLADAERQAAQMQHDRDESTEARVAALGRDLTAAREQLARALAAAPDRVRNDAAAKGGAPAATGTRRVADAAPSITMRPGHDLATVNDPATQRGAPRPVVPPSIGPAASEEARLPDDSVARPPASTTFSLVTPVKDALPPGVVAHVILRYPEDSRTARTRAAAATAALRAQGLEVAEPVGSKVRITAGQITYFYAQDADSARAVGGILTDYGVKLSRSTVSEPPPRPGTIEVTVAG